MQNNNLAISTTKFYGLDHLRAFAIIFVFYFHYPFLKLPSWLENIKDFGWTAVDLFFVLSGFLIANNLFYQIKNKEASWIKPFFIKRVLRIVPVYFIVVALYFFIPSFNERSDLAPLWKFLTFTQNIGLKGGAFSHAWSLCIEEQFYLFFPFIILISTYLKFPNKGFYIILFFFALTFFIRLFLWYRYMEPLIQADGNYGNFWLTWI